MGRIKGWKKFHKVGKTISWVHSNGSAVLLTKLDNIDRWDVDFVPKNSNNMKNLGSFKTKTKAQKFAIQWMRSHPNG